MKARFELVVDGTVVATEAKCSALEGRTQEILARIAAGSGETLVTRQIGGRKYNQKKDAFEPVESVTHLTVDSAAKAAEMIRAARETYARSPIFEHEFD